jgi:Sugar phosphate permease
MLGKENASFSLLGLIIWLLASFFFLYEFFLRTFVGTIANQIMHDLALSPEMFALLGSAYYFAYALMQVPVGILTDKFGVRRILIFAILVCVISAFLFANAASFSQAFISRMMMGFGSSFAFVCLLVIAATWFPRKYFGFFVGASQFIGTMGPLLAAGPLAAVLVKSNGDWRTLLADIGIIGGILALLISCL